MHSLKYIETQIDCIQENPLMYHILKQKFNLLNQELELFHEVLQEDNDIDPNYKLELIQRILDLHHDVFYYSSYKSFVSKAEIAIENNKSEILNEVVIYLQKITKILISISRRGIIVNKLDITDITRLNFLDFNYFEINNNVYNFILDELPIEVDKIMFSFKVLSLNESAIQIDKYINQLHQSQIYLNKLQNHELSFVTNSNHVELAEQIRKDIDLLIKSF